MVFLGHGNFGSVMKGVYMISNGKSIAVAVKTLKEENIPNQQVCDLIYFRTSGLS